MTGLDGSGGSTWRRIRSTGLREALWCEWTKLVTLRSNLALLVAIGVALPALAIVVAVTGSLQPDDTVLGASVLAGASLAQLLAVALGSMTVTGEVRTGMMRLTLLACPRRWVVLAAKALVTAALVGAVVVPATAVAFLIGVGLLGDDHATGQLFPAVLGIGLAVGSMAVLGVAIGSLVRSSAMAVLVGVAIVLLPGMLAPMLGSAQRWIGGASLSGVMQKLAQSSDATAQSVGSLAAWPSLLVVAAYTIAAVGIAAAVERHRDT